MGNLLSINNIPHSQANPLLIVERLLFPTQVFGNDNGGGGGGGSGGKYPPPGSVPNPYKKKDDKSPPPPNTDNEGSAKSFDGRSSSTKKGHNGAIKKWNMFADKNDDIPRYEQLRVANVCGQVYANNTMAHPNNPPIRVLMEKFAQFLIDYRKSSSYEDGDEDDYYDEDEDEIEVLFESTGTKPYNGLAPGTILGHFTRMKSLLFDKFRPLSSLGDMPDWYSKLHRTLKNRVVSACIARGGVVSKKTVGIGRKALANMCEHFFRQSSATGYEKRCVLAVVFAAVGRGGEISFTTWDGVRWDVDREHLVIDWGEVKKGVQYLMTFHPDANNWRIDVLHSIACYVLCDPGGSKASTTPQEAGVNWIFPNYADMADGGAAAKISRVVDEAKEAGVEYLEPTATSHGLRVGATDEMVYHYMINVFDAISRGGWDCKTDSLIFHYLTVDKNIDRAGKALANFHDPNMKVSAPTLEAFVTAENKSVVEAFCQKLFGTSCIPNVNGIRMKPVRDVLVASLLRFYNVILEEDRTCLVIKKIQNAAINSGVDLGTLKQWGQLVENRFLVENAQNLGNSGGTDTERLSTALTIVQESCAKTSAQLLQLQASNREMGRKVDNCTALMEAVAKNQESLLKYHESTSKKLDSMLDWMDTSNQIVPQELSPLKRRAESPPAADAASPAAKKACTTNANDELKKPKAEVNWRDCGEWSPAELMKQLLTSRMDVESNHFLPAKASDDQKQKNRLTKLRHNARAVVKKLTYLASGEQKRFFDWKNLPTETDAETEWLNEMMEAVKALTILMTKQCVQDVLRGEGKFTEKAFKKKFRNTKLMIGPLGHLLTAANTASKNLNNN